jgi:hypothetical protein
LGRMLDPDTYGVAAVPATCRNLIDIYKARN